MFRSYYETLNVRARTVAACAPYDYVLSPVAPVVAYNAEWPSPTNEVATTMHHIGFTLPFNMSEQPAASVNCGYTKAGLPIGLQIAGPRFDDLGVLRIARAWERLRPRNIPGPSLPRRPDPSTSTPQESPCVGFWQMIKHETNTFSPVPTPLERFFRGNPEILAGERAIKAYENTDSGLGGYIEVARLAGAEMVVPVAAESWPSGPASAETHERLCKLILDEVKRGGFDAILLDLHGAMVAEGVDDAEGDLLRRLREIDPATPVAVTLDMHANIYDDIVKNATVISGFTPIPTWTSANGACGRPT